MIIILSIVIKGWHNIIPRNIETIQTSDGYELDISAVQKLVQAMSAFQPQATNVTNGSVSQQMHQFMQQIQASSYWQQSENAGIL
ncbi:hypothetical protein JF634_06220 [Simonsiella muelleri]|uniref:hypothetical protein n=1 Tax=Simonsiella muelleri TaxID=72 RepID=UPI0001D08E47|nr:hypothetical protein [Simonsiella muelleri]AUX62335.1 hypothetical protein BWP33_11350 [Simonsiella muelleri ATCC 29453]UBQ52833.1 hypothetical protein JF634_06220 [Simonsiella muelleri]